MSQSPFRRKILKVSATILVVLVLWVTCRITGVLQYYSVPSVSNTPTFKPGKILFTSNLKTPAALDFIAFKIIEPVYQQERIWIFRVVGKEGDKVEIKEGDAYVNDVNVDRNISLVHAYLLNKNKMDKLGEVDPDYGIQKALGNDFVLLLPTDIKDKYVKEARRYLMPQSADATALIQRTYKANWTTDNFGPVMVPKDNYFVLADNRESAIDSRYFGFIPEADVLGTVLNE